MSRRRCLPLVVVVTLVACAAGAAEPAAEQRRTIAVTGQAEVKAKPDRLVVSFAVETTAARATDAAAENAKRSAAVVEAVKRLLAPDDIVTTTRFDVEPRYEQPRPGEAREPHVTGYVVRNEIEVASGHPAQAGALIDAATTAGANRVSGLRFTLARRDEAVGRALEQAGADARTQADALARGLGVRVKGLVSAVTTAGAPVPRRFEAMEASALRTPTPVEAGEASVQVTVQATFEIE
jgi:uncharacterized protein